MKVGEKIRVATKRSALITTTGMSAIVETAAESPNDQEGALRPMSANAAHTGNQPRKPPSRAHQDQSCT